MPRSLVAVALALIACGGSTPSEETITPAVLIPGQPAIPYPPALFQKAIEGEVLLYLVVDSSGTVVRDSSHIAHSSGHSEFDAAALEAAAGLRFTPAQRNGLPVMAPIQVPIQFTIPDSSRAGGRPST